MQKNSDKDLAYLFITDPKGEVTAHTFGEAFPIDLKKVGSSDQQTESLHRVRIDGQQVLNISYPIFGGSLGTSIWACLKLAFIVSYVGYSCWLPR